MCFYVVRFFQYLSVCSGLGRDGGSFCDFTLFFQLFEFGLGFFELSLESRVSVEACDGDSSCDTSGIDIALEMVTADDAAFAHLISAFEDFVLALRVDFGKNQRCRLADGCVA